MYPTPGFLQKNSLLRYTRSILVYPAPAGHDQFIVTSPLYWQAAAPDPFAPTSSPFGRASSPLSAYLPLSGSQPLAFGAQQQAPHLGHGFGGSLSFAVQSATSSPTWSISRSSASSLHAPPFRSHHHRAADDKLFPNLDRVCLRLNNVYIARCLRRLSQATRWCCGSVDDLTPNGQYELNKEATICARPQTVNIHPSRRFFSYYPGADNFVYRRSDADIRFPFDEEPMPGDHLWVESMFADLRSSLYQSSEASGGEADITKITVYGFVPEIKYDIIDQWDLRRLFGEEAKFDLDEEAQQRAEERRVCREATRTVTKHLQMLFEAWQREPSRPDRPAFMESIQLSLKLASEAVPCECCGRGCD